MSIMPIQRIRLLVLLLISCCILMSGCSANTEKAPEGPSEEEIAINLKKEENQAIRDAMKMDGFGMGEKTALYDPNEDLYFFTGDYLPETLRASEPNEIGAFISYQDNEINKPEGTDYSVTYIYAFDTSVHITCYGKNDSSNSNEKHKYLDTVVDENGNMDSSIFLMEWIKSKNYEMLSNRDSMILCSKMNDGTAVPGGGRKLLSYNKETGEYGTDHLYSTDIANNEEELGYILSYVSSFVEVSGDYIFSKKDGSSRVHLEGVAELLELELYDAVSGELLGTKTMGGEAPYTLTIWNDNEPTKLFETVSKNDIREKFLDLYIKE